MKNLIPLTLAFTVLTTSIFAGKPDKNLHKKCIYPTVMLSSKTGVGSGVILKSVKQEDDTYLNLVATCAHILVKTPAVYEKIDPPPKKEGPPKKIDPDQSAEKALKDAIENLAKPKMLKPARYEYKVSVGNYKDWSNLIGLKNYDCKIVAEDKAKDVALVTFISKEKMYTADLDFSPKLYIGNEVYRIGCGLNEPFRLDFGRITSLDNSVGSFIKKTYRTSIMTVPGDSGGPVFHENKMIGVAQAIRTMQTGPFSHTPICHMSFVIPLSRYVGSEAIRKYLKSNCEFSDLIQD